MRVTDLSHLIHQGMPVFTGTEPPVFQIANTISGNGFKETKITLYSHTGTHMDAPAHMLPEGDYLNEMGVQCFIGKGMILNFKQHLKSTITLDELKPYHKMIKKTEFVLLNTGWDQYWGRSQYFDQYPVLSQEAASWLANFPIKGFGVDTISIDSLNSIHFKIHKILLSKNIVIIENLTNLQLIKSQFFQFISLPLSIQDADGSPVRAVAIE